MRTRNSWTQTPTRRARLMHSRTASGWCRQEVWQASVWHQISAALTSMSSDGAELKMLALHEFSWTAHHSLSGTVPPLQQLSWLCTPERC